MSVTPLQNASQPSRRAIFAAGALAAAAMASRRAAAQGSSTSPALAYKQTIVPGFGGTPIATYEYGNAAGVPILLIHGYGQCNLSWDKQVADPALAREFRLVTLDLRGHGLSGMPEGDQYYKPSAPWAADVDAVIRTLDLRRPVLVGWSFGGRVLGDYLAAHGDAGIGGLNFVDAATTTSDLTLFGPKTALAGPRGYASPDLRTAIAATRDFLRACFEQQPSAEEFETMVGFMTMVPRHARLSMLGRQASYDAAWKAVRVPALVTHGAKDQLALVGMARYTAAAVPQARLSVYDGAGHSPFWEDPQRFNRELAELARSAPR